MLRMIYLVVLMSYFGSRMLSEQKKATQTSFFFGSSFQRVVQKTENRQFDLISGFPRDTYN